MSPSALKAKVMRADEDDGVHRRLVARVQTGEPGRQNPSHPATIGSRVLPVNITLACATRTTASTMIVRLAIGIVRPRR